jgi:outer membrane protein assembly factor BamB
MSDGQASRRQFIATVAGLSAVGLSGCGSDGSSTETANEPTGTGAQTGTLTPTATPTDTPAETVTELPPETETEEPTPSPTPTPDPTSYSDWPTYMYNEQNWGDHPDAVGPDGPVSVDWQRDLNAAQANATAVLADGQLYVGDGRPNDDEGTLYALNPVTGETLWSTTLDGPITGGAVVSNDYVFTATGEGFRALRTDGSVLWSSGLDGRVNFGPPTATDNAVYFGANSGRLFKLNQLSGAREWTYRTFGEIPSAPVVTDDRVFVGSRDGNVYALDPSGNEVWVRESGSTVNGFSLRDDGLYIAREGGRLRKLDTRNNELWTQNFEGNVRTTPAVTEDLVYAGTSDNKLYAMDRGEGIVQWEFDGANASITAPPVVVEGTVYFGCQDDRVYALDAETGDRQWRFETEGAIVNPAPVVAGGRVFIGSRDGNFYALSD